MKKHFLVSILTLSSLSCAKPDAAGLTEQGRYDPTRVRTNPQAKACWVTNGMSSEDLSLTVPKLEQKLQEQIVSRTGGKLNPFPTDVSAVAVAPSGAWTARLPNCKDAPRSYIRLHLFDFDLKSERETAQKGGQIKTATSGRFYEQCLALSFSPTNENSTFGHQSPNFGKKGLSPSCIVVYTGLPLSVTKSRNDAFFAQVSLSFLHELLHAYGAEHEHLHAENRTKLLANKNAPDVCDYTKFTAIAPGTAVTAEQLKKMQQEAEKQLNREIAQGVDFGAFDKDSVMNYCQNTKSVTFATAALSNGDVALLQFLYNVAATTGTVSTVPPPPQPVPSAAPTPAVGSVTPAVPTVPAPVTPASTTCTAATESNFSSGWRTSYILKYSQATNWTVDVTARSTAPVNGAAAAPVSWGSYPVSTDLTQRQKVKFLTYPGQGNRMLEHTTEDVPTVVIPLVCNPPL